MKKTLFFALLLSAGLYNSQVLESDNFNSLSLGNISSDLTGTAAGAGGWYTYVASGAVTNFQIVSVDGSHGNSAQITGSATTSGTRYLWKSNLSTTWGTRTTGNDILKGTFEIYTGSVTGGAATIRSYVYETTNPVVGVGYDYTSTSTKIKGYAYGTDTSGTGTYSFTLGTATYPANTWISVGYTFNQATGAITWTTPEGTFSPGATFTPGSTGLDPVEQDFLSTVTTGNAVAHISAVDNYQLEAVNTILATHEATIDKMSFISIFPNPTSDFVNIKTKSPILNVKLYDNTGKMVVSKGKVNQLDVRNLSKGTYIINVETQDGIQTLKFIKK